ncbi:MAG TPA: PLP-dependent aminotransferase family protein [Spongiibacteraceae bacterium]|nr:PLP-dependent aminotransferase family protein [Spongiibacteraceae bacterium]
MSTDSKYQLLANELEEAIHSGRLAIGSRLASVRKVMEQRSLSLATVVAAYRTLEERGLIEARAKSGYFVIGKSAGAKSSAIKSPGASVATPSTSPVNANCPDLELFPRQRLHRLTASVVRRHQYLPTTYAHGLGNTKLRGEIARRSADFGSFIRAEELIVTNGATEALSLALRAVARPGDSIAVETPANPLFLALLAELHIEVVEIPALSAQGLSLAALEQALLDHPNLRACLLVPNFHHPTGALMPVATKRALLALAERAKLALIEDDVYGDLQHEGPRPPPLKAFDSNGSVIYVNSYSKTIAPGMQVGWIAAGRWHAQIEASKQSVAVATAELPQLVLYEFLNRGSHVPHLRRMRQLLRESTQRVHDGLARALPKECQWVVPAGGYFLWLELPTGISTAQLLEQPALAPLGISSGRHCSVRGDFDHCLRINTSLLDQSAIAPFAVALERALAG